MSRDALGVLALGAILMFAAVLAPPLRGASIGNSTGTWTRVTAAVAGAALLCWVLISTLVSQSAPQPAPAAPYTPAPAPVDLIDAASTAMQACPSATPPTVPNGTTASREEMAAATAAFKSFDAATNSYVQCVDATVARVGNQYAGVTSQDELHALKEFGTAAHNTAIDQEKASVDQFNAQIRTYKAQHPQS